MRAEQAIRICEACDRFEWNWLKGDPLPIERFLDEARPEDRCLLFEGLLRIELEWRRDAGEEPEEREYVARFPDWSERIWNILRQAATPCDQTSLQAVGRYTLLEELGRGRQGVVYRAREEGIVPLEVAVKLLGAGLVRSRSDALRFCEEIQTLARVNHPHVVPFLGSGDDRGQLYYAMRLIRGSSLDRILKERGGPMDPWAAARLIISIVEAVNYLHTQQPPIVHRDLNPRNVLLDEAGRPYVADFGLAFLLDGADAGDGACGTIPYIAPEQFDHRFGEVGPACDIYSLGVMLYQMITGHLPFPSDRESIIRTLETEPIPPRRLNPRIPTTSKGFASNACASRTRERYSSAAELLDHLRCFERGEPLPIPPDGPWRRIVYWARRQPALAARLGVIVACSVILWGYAAVKGGLATLQQDHWVRGTASAAILPPGVPIEVPFAVLTQLILLTWGATSWFFQRMLERNPDRDRPRFAWWLVNIVSLCLLIQLDDALMSPLTVAFPILIAASALSGRAAQVTLDDAPVGLGLHPPGRRLSVRAPGARSAVSPSSLPSRPRLARAHIDLPGKPYASPGTGLRCSGSALSEPEIEPARAAVASRRQSAMGNSSLALPPVLDDIGDLPRSTPARDRRERADRCISSP